MVWMKGLFLVGEQTSGTADEGGGGCWDYGR